MKYDRISTYFRKQFGINVGTLREEKGYTQAELAMRASIDRSYISLVENAKCNITLDIIIKIADGLDVPLTALFEGLDQRPPSEILSYDYGVTNVTR